MATRIHDEGAQSREIEIDGVELPVWQDDRILDLANMTRAVHKFRAEGITNQEDLAELVEEYLFIRDPKWHASLAKHIRYI